MDLVDTHCHLHFENYDAGLGEVLAASATAGVKRIICVGCSLSDSQQAIDFAKNQSGVWATAGAHPNDGADFLTDKDAAAKLKKMLAEPKVVAVGEIGLDYYRDFTPKADQEKTLRPQLEIGLETSLPFVFHVREAWKDFWRIFDSYKNLKGVIHSFSASPQDLDEVLSRNLYVGLNGIMTFTKDPAQLEAARRVPLNKLLLETDAPFLAPQPFRGQRNEPKNITDICKFLAELRNESPEELAAASTKNAVELFGLSDERLA